MTDIPKYESAKLILQLYDLRREEKMREARSWVFAFAPKSFAEIQAVVKGPDGAKLRMVLGYWDMAAALVNDGAIDEKMFMDTNGEFWFAFAKVQPFLAEARNLMGPQYLKHLEELILRQPGAQAKLDAILSR